MIILENQENIDKHKKLKSFQIPLVRVNYCYHIDMYLSRNVCVYVKERERMIY